MGDIIHSLTVTEKEEEIEQFHYSMDHNSDTENNMASDRPSQVDNVNVDDTEELEQRLQDLRTERRKAELRWQIEEEKELIRAVTTTTTMDGNEAASILPMQH